MPSSVTIVAIVAAYNEEDVIGQVVRALIEEGVQVYFLDHHSTDQTVAQVEPYQGRGVIGIETFPADDVEDVTGQSFVWERVLRRKEELAQALDADWFIHHDADEFRESPWSGQTLREGIQRVDAAGYNAIDFQVLNFSPTTADPVDAEDIRDRLLFCEPGGAFDRQQIKCWKKTGQPVVLTESGGHSAEFLDRRICPIRFLLRHYPIRSQAHGERKVFQERLPRFAPLERARGWHVQYNDLVEGASFVRDPTSLRRYDPEAVRLDLFLRHREVERLELLAAAADGLTAELDRLRPERERLLSDLEALRSHLQAQDTELDRLRSERERLVSDLQAQDTELDRLRSERERLLSDLQAKDAELDTLRSRLAAREATIAKVLASRSWKLTAPLRAADRLLRGSPESS